MDLDNNSIDTAGEEEIIGINLSETKIENNKVENLNLKLVTQLL